MPQSICYLSIDTVFVFSTLNIHFHLGLFDWQKMPSPTGNTKRIEFSYKFCRHVKKHSLFFSPNFIFKMNAFAQLPFVYSRKKRMLIEPNHDLWNGITLKYRNGRKGCVWTTKRIKVFLEWMRTKMGLAWQLLEKSLCVPCFSKSFPSQPVFILNNFNDTHLHSLSIEASQIN